MKTTKYNTDRYLITINEIDGEEYIRFQSIDGVGPDGEIHGDLSDISFPLATYTVDMLKSNIPLNIGDLEENILLPLAQKKGLFSPL